MLDALAHARGVLIRGDAGVGKTTLADLVVEQYEGSADDGRRPDVVTLVATEARRGLPLAALDPLLEQGSRDGARPSDLAGVAAEVARRLTDHAAGAAVVLRIEDANLLDPASAECVAALVDARVCTLVATARSGAALPRSMAMLMRVGLITQVSLGGFARDQLVDVLTTALGGPVDLATAIAFWEATSGNAFYAREALGEALASGMLRRVDGIWVAAGPFRPGDVLGTLAASDLADLPDAVRRAAEMIAVAEPLPLASLAGTVDDATLDNLVERGLVVVSTGGGRPPTVGIAHPLYAEAVRSQVPPRRRQQLLRVLHSQLASAGSSSNAARTIRSVAWSVECGLDPGVDELIAAARSATALGDFNYPIPIATAALAQLADDDPRRVDALVARATAYRYGDQPAHAYRDLADATEQMRTRTPDHDVHWANTVADIAMVHADLLQYHDDRVDAALDVIDGAVATLTQVCPDEGATGEAAARLRANRLARTGYAGRFDAFVPAAWSALADDDLSMVDRLGIVGPLLMGLAFRGEFARCHELIDEFLPVAVAYAAEAPWAAGELQATAFMSILLSGRLDRLKSIAGQRLAPRHVALRFDHATQETGLGQWAISEGRWTDAAAHLRAAAVRYDEGDRSGLLAFALAHEAFALAALGDAATAARRRGEATSTRLRTTRVAEPQFRWLLVATAVALGEPDAARQATELVEWCVEHDYRAIELRSYALLASMGRADAAVADAATTCAAALTVPIAAAIADYVDAVAAGDVQVASARQARLAQFGLILPTPLTRNSLSRREREIAGLAAAGLSSREIADRLNVSVRTVDSHLAHAFEKLGIRRRGDLPGALS